MLAGFPSFDCGAYSASRRKKTTQDAGKRATAPCQWTFHFSKAVDKAVVLEFRFASGAVVPVKSGSCTSEKSAHVSSQGSLEK